MMGWKSKFRKVTRSIGNVVSSNPVSSVVEAVTDNKYLGWVAKPADWLILPGSLQYDIYSVFKDENKSISQHDFSDDNEVSQKLHFDVVTPKLYPPFKDWVLKQGEAPLRITHTRRSRELTDISFVASAQRRYHLKGHTREDALRKGYIESITDPLGLVCYVLVKARADLKLVGWHYWDNKVWNWLPLMDYEGASGAGSEVSTSNGNVKAEEVAPWNSQYSVIFDCDSSEGWRFQMLYFIGEDSAFEGNPDFELSVDGNLRAGFGRMFTRPLYKDSYEKKQFKFNKINI